MGRFLHVHPFRELREMGAKRPHTKEPRMTKTELPNIPLPEKIIESAHETVAGEQLHILTEITQHINSGSSLRDVLNRVYEKAALIHSANVLLVFFTEGDKLVFRQADFSKSPHHGDEFLCFGQCLCGIMAQSGKPQYAYDIVADPRCTLHFCLNMGLNSFAAIPLYNGRKLIGALGLGSKQKYDFSQQAEFLEALASVIQLALINAKLHDALQKKYGELKKLNENLEMQVETRTRELSEANRSLKLEIHAHEQTEKALQDTQALHNAILDNLNDAVFVLQDDKMIFVNRVAYESLGYTPEEIRANPPFSRIIPEDRLRAQDAYARMMQTGRSEKHVEWRWQDKSKKLHWARASGVRITVEGRPAGLVIRQDITESKNLEKRIEEIQAQLTTLVETANDVVYITDRHGKFTYMNPTGVRLSGFTQEELLDKYFVDLVLQECREDMLAFYRRQYVTRTPSTYYRFPTRSKSGKTLWFGQNVSLVIRDGKIVGYQAIARDITEIHKAQEALRINEEKFRLLSENTSDVFGLLQAEPPYSFEFVNAAYSRLFGTSSEELYKDTMAWMAHMHPEDKEAGAQAFNSFILNPEDVEHEFRVLGVAGAVRWVWVSGRPVRDGNNEIKYLLIVARDITERKLEEDRHKNFVQEMKDFAHIISHDFRTPLINIKGYTQELEEAVQSMTPNLPRILGRLEKPDRDLLSRVCEKDVPEALFYIKTSTARLDTLTKSMLNLARVEKREFYFEPLNMNQLVQNVLDQMQYKLTDNNIGVAVGELPDVVADRLALEQIFTNLIDNAIKYRDPVRRQVINIFGYHFPDETAFVVADRGIGIQDNEMSRIFQIFSRSKDAKIEGEGIGLTYCRSFVRKHGGNIWCESAPGKKTVFTFTISNSLKPYIEPA